MNEQQVFQVMNPLAATINEGEQIIAQINEASEVLEACIADAQAWQQRSKDASDIYESAEYEELAEVIILAQAKEGPLGGIAVSGKGYDIVLTKLKGDLRKGKLQRLWNSAEQTRRNYELAKMDFERATQRFNGLRKIADLKTQILRAATI